MAALPPRLKGIQSYISVSNQYKQRDPIISYYCHLYALNKGLPLAKGDSSAKEAILKLMDDAENLKKSIEDKEYIKDEIVAQSYVEDAALKLFNKADQADRAAMFDKKLTKMFYVSSQLFTVLEHFGDLTDEIEHKRKYAKWKAVEIDRCLKNGITPTPGPAGINEGEEDDDPSQFGQPVAIPPQPPGSYSGVQPYPPMGPPYPPTNSATPPYPPTTGIPPPTDPTPTVSPYPPSAVSPYPPAPQPATGPTPTPLPRSNPPGTRTTPIKLGETTTGGGGGGKVEISGVQKETVQKYCKYAISSMDFNDTEGAISFLEKSLRILKTGKED